VPSSSTAKVRAPLSRPAPSQRESAGALEGIRTEIGTLMFSAEYQQQQPFRSTI
jgi:hypothetical protein